VEQDEISGSACSGATDVSTCMRSLEALKPTVQGCETDQACRAIVTTQGDAPSRIEDRAALVALLGTIDTPQKAALVAWLDGRDIQCWNEDFDPPLGARARRVEGGIELQTNVQASCTDEMVMRVERVEQNGEIFLISENRSGPTCVA
jgi:hypothetical protein